MSSSPDEQGSTQRKYKGVRRRTWGKYVSEIRVPGTQDRLWLGSYATAEAAAVARDIAFYCLRGESGKENLNFFPLTLPANAQIGMSPRSVQRAASDAGMAIDAQLVSSKREPENIEDIGNGSGTETEYVLEEQIWQKGCSGKTSELDDDKLSISIDDYL